MIERCSTFGAIAVTSSATVAAPANAHLQLQIQKEQQVIDIPDATVVPISTAIQKIKIAALELSRASPHPKGQSVVGIRSESLEQLQIVLARSETRQRSLDDRDLKTVAQEEIEDTASTYARLASLANKAKNGKATAEEFVSAMRAESDPSRACSAVYQMVNKRQTILVGEHQVVTADSRTAGSTEIELRAAEAYLLCVTVHSVNADTGEVSCRLIGGERLDRLFSDVDINRRILQFRVVGQALFLLALCASVGAQVDIVASVRLLVTPKGATYRCTLINFKDLKRLSGELRKSIENQYGSLDGI